MLKVVLVCLLLCLAAALPVGCAESNAEQAGGREPAAKPVKTEPVRQESVRRALEVVGTLAAEDEVTISSQAEGAVSRVLADLGDPVRAGQALVELDREKLEYSLDQQKAALARALTAVRRVRTRAICRRSSRRRTCRKRPPSWSRRSRRHDRADELHKRTADSAAVAR